jgi:serine/threonine protein kinase/formylglycine-generating enzyme required for sulfatase activity
MREPSTPESAAVVNAFIRLYLDDLDKGRTRTVQEYQALFPGYEDDVEAELCELQLERDGQNAEPSDDAATPNLEGDLGSARIGPYKLLEIVGKGGMGVVYLAERTGDIRKRVALKAIKLGMDSKEVLARFEAERQALALMSHPNVAQVHDAGTAEDGRPYFVMEYVPGLPITEYCDRHKLGLRERIELFLQVCRGVEHAHHRGVVHRDIKPSNILVAMTDDAPVAKIIDFGVAKATNQRLTERTIYTEIGRTVGTPQYMSPEQAELTGEEVDHRTDVYSLGAVLYELLVGELPIEWEGLRRAALDEVLRRVREDEPTPPSVRWSRLNLERTSDLAQKRRTSPAALRQELRGDLDWVVMKALEKERQRRYSTVAALMEDLKRYLSGEAVLARPPSVLYRARKYVRRHRTPVFAAGAVVLALAAGLAASIVFALDARENFKLANRREGEARENLDLAKERLDEVLRLADVKRLQDYVAEAEALWPALPEKVAPMEAWLKKAEALAGRLVTHRATLEALREKALPYDEAQRAADRASHPEAARLTELEGEREMLADEAKKLAAKHGEEPRATLLSYGEDPQTKPLAVYFRRVFEVGDTVEVEALALRLIADDGAVVYLNGKEVLRVRMPDGEPSFSTEATGCLVEPVADERRLPSGGLLVGRNVIAVEVHQDRPFCTDLNLELELAAGREQLIPRGSTWRYHEGATEPPAAWRDPGFNDSSWPEGPAPLGYGFASGPGRLLEIPKEANEIQASIAELEAKVSVRRTSRFHETELQWQHDTVAGLVDGIERLANPNARKGALASVRQRLEFARTVEKRTVEDYRNEWNEAIAAVRQDPRFNGLNLKPQVGLIPIRKDPVSELWEFAHIQTGMAAQRGADGKLVLTEETGLVFVLVPGGTFFMGAEPVRLGVVLVVEGDELRVSGGIPGSLGDKLGLEAGDVLLELNGRPLKTPQDTDAALGRLRSRGEVTVECRRGDEHRTLRCTLGSNIDPQAHPEESPVHEVTLESFFLSKYEMTQGQWLCVTGGNPSYYHPTRKVAGRQRSLVYPVEQVSWDACEQELPRLGFLLPTEAQWEYACRGGTESVWSTGDERESLRGAVNVADQAAARSGVSWPAIKDWPNLDDRWDATAPVGTYRGNRFGLHDMHGNVEEWCRDLSGSYELPVAAGDGQPRVACFRETSRIRRGGDYRSRASDTRTASRHKATPTIQSSAVGVRPAMLIAE